MTHTKAPALTALALSAALLSACDRDDWLPESSFSETVRQAYAECSAAEVRFLASKHGIQTAFENCGSNHFVHFAWSPDGVNLYFQLPLAGHVMNAEDKTIGALPTEQPVTNAVWLGSDLLVLALGPAEGETSHRLVLYNLSQGSLETVSASVGRPRLLQANGTRDQVLVLASTEDGADTFHRVDFTNRSVTPDLAWWSGAVDSFTTTPEQGAVLIGSGGKVTAYALGTGEVLDAWEDAARGSMHPDGRFVALETTGDPISPFDQRTWNELTPEARERELRRQQEWLARQPDWVPKEILPPAIDVGFGEVSQRFRFDAFYGDRFQWYSGAPDPTRYASFVLWGIEGKELNKNVALTDLSERLRFAASGTLPMGVSRYGEKSPSSQDVSEETPPAVAE